MPTITPEFAQQIQTMRQNQMMMGMEPYLEPQVGGDAMEYLSNLWFGGGDGHDLAPQLAEQLGISSEQFNSQMTDTNARTASSPNFIGGAISGIGTYASEHPAVYLAPLALGGALGAFGAGAGGAGAGTLTSTASDAAFGAAGAGTAGGGTLAGLGGGGLTGSALGAGGATGAAASLAPGLGLGSAVGSGLAAAGAAGAGGGVMGALSGIGLPGWLTIGATAAQALQGTPDIQSSSTNAPPAYLAPYLQQAAGQASQLYGQGNYISPIEQSATDYGRNVLTGNYLNANPYLDATFNKAAGAVTNQVQSNFALAGRNVRGPDAAGLATDKYSELANQIYGSNYQAERDRMQQVLPIASQLGQASNPGRPLDDYIARLRNLGGGYGSTTSSTPTDNNWLSGLAGLGLALIPGH